MGGRCFKAGEEETLREEVKTQGLALPLLSRSDLDLAETKIKCQILEKQLSDERSRLQGINSDLRSIHTDNDRARDQIKEVNARIQQLELRSLKSDKADLLEQERRRTEQRSKLHLKDQISSLTLQFTTSKLDLESLNSQIESISSAIHIAEVKAKGMESGLEQPVSWPSLKMHYVRGLILHVRGAEERRLREGMAKWRVNRD